MIKLFTIVPPNTKPYLSKYKVTKTRVILVMNLISYESKFRDELFRYESNI